MSLSREEFADTIESANNQITHLNEILEQFHRSTNNLSSTIDTLRQSINQLQDSAFRPSHEFQTGNLVETTTAPHDDRLLVVIRTSRQYIYLAAAEAPLVQLCRKPRAELRLCRNQGTTRGNEYYIDPRTGERVDIPPASSESSSVSTHPSADTFVLSSSDAPDDPQEINRIIVTAIGAPTNTLADLQWNPAA